MTHEVTVRKKEQEGGKAGGTLAPALAAGPGAGRRPSRASVPLGGEGQRRTGRRRASGVEYRAAAPRAPRDGLPRATEALVVLLAAATFSVVFHEKRQEGEPDGAQEACPEAPGEGGRPPPAPRPRQQPPQQPSARRTAFPDCKLTLFLIICFAVGAADLTSEGQSCICLNDQKQYTFYPQTPRLENYLKN